MEQQRLKEIASSCEELLLNASDSDLNDFEEQKFSKEQHFLETYEMFKDLDDSELEDGVLVWND